METIPDAEFKGGYLYGSCALSLDHEGDAHVVLGTNEIWDGYGYYSAIYHFTNESGSWRGAELYYCFYGDVYATSIAADSLGQPGIAFGTNGGACYGPSLWYAYRVGANPPQWTKEIVDAGPGSAGEISLGFDAGGRPHIAYDVSADIVFPPASMKYAVRTDGAWQIEVLEGPSGSLSRKPSLAVDSENTPHISYYEPVMGDLVYAWRESGVWRKEVVDSVGNVGRFASLQLNASGEPAISYRDETDGSVRYAFKRNSQWTLGDVDATDGGWTSLALDFAGAPHVAYWAGGLKYARRQSVVEPEPTGVAIPVLGDFTLVVAPNPSRVGETIIRFAAPEGSPVGVEILDVSGRRVRSLVCTAMSSGTGRIRWDGRDDRACPVASGTYFIRTASSNRQVVARFQLVR